MRDRFRIFSSRSGSGLAITPGPKGWSAATWRPRSVTMTGSRVVAACRTHRPVARCSSRIVIVLMCTLWHEQRARARFSRSPAELEAGVGGRRSARRDRGLCLADGGQLGLEPLELALEGRARLLGAAEVVGSADALEAAGRLGRRTCGEGGERALQGMRGPGEGAGLAPGERVADLGQQLYSGLEGGAQDFEAKAGV